jgi:hypothetical protein
MKTDTGGAAGDEDVAVRRDEHLDQQEEDSFPASDPHSDWAGPGDAHERP